MAFLFAHEWIAKLALEKIRKKNLISDYANIDGYFFGAIAPDIRYVNNSRREVTHVRGSAFDAFRGSGSEPFIAGLETHFIVDDAWSNERNWLEESIYDFYKLDPNNTAQKFALYFLVDDYFQAEANWLFPIECAGNILRADDVGILLGLGFSHSRVALYKSGAAVYLRELGIDTLYSLNFAPNKLDEVLVRRILEEKSALTDFLKKFKIVSVENCVASLEANL
ncbi:MAG: hypothetical protein V1676_06805 [Candidatus Diapherotrites archaeon]